MLIAFLIVAVLLLALGPAGFSLPPLLVPRAAVGLALLAISLALAGLLLGTETFEVAGLLLRLDGLSGYALLPALLALAPSLLFDTRRAAPAAGAMLALVLGDGLLAVIALAVLCLALRVRTIPVAAWALCAAVALATLKLEPALSLPLAGLGLGALWFGAAEPALGIVGFYVLARTGLTEILPVPFGLAVLGFGLLGAVVGGVRAAAAVSFAGSLPGFAASATGLASAGLGVAMAARGADLLPVAGLGLSASLLGLLAQGLALGGLGLAAGAVRSAAGSGALAGLGGLWRTMPATGLSAVIAGASLAAVPPAVGFTSFYALLQALFAAHRIGGVGLQLTLALGVAVAGLAAGLAALATLRLIGLVFLGPARGGAASDPRGDVRLGMAVLAGLGVLLAVAPQLPMLLAGRALADAGLPQEPAGFAPTVVAALVAASCAAGWAVMRLAPRARRVPAWEGGLPPAASNLVAYVPGLLVSWRWRPRLRPPALRDWLACAGLALVIVLIVLAAR